MLTNLISKRQFVSGTSKLFSTLVKAMFLAVIFVLSACSSSHTGKEELKDSEITNEQAANDSIEAEANKMVKVSTQKPIVFVQNKYETQKADSLYRIARAAKPHYPNKSINEVVEILYETNSAAFGAKQDILKVGKTIEILKPMPVRLVQVEKNDVMTVSKEPSVGISESESDKGELLADEQNSVLEPQDVSTVDEANEDNSAEKDQAGNEQDDERLTQLEKGYQLLQDDMKTLLSESQQAEKRCAKEALNAKSRINKLVNFTNIQAGEVSELKKEISLQRLLTQEYLNLSNELKEKLTQSQP